VDIDLVQDIQALVDRVELAHSLDLLEKSWVQGLETPRAVVDILLLFGDMLQSVVDTLQMEGNILQFEVDTLHFPVDTLLENSLRLGDFDCRLDYYYIVWHALVLIKVCEQILMQALKKTEMVMKSSKGMRMFDGCSFLKYIP
jgi:hypothetical protein